MGTQSTWGMGTLVMVRFYLFLVLVVHLCLCQEDSEGEVDVATLTKKLTEVLDYFQRVNKEYEAFHEAESRVADRSNCPFQASAQKIEENEAPPTLVCFIQSWAAVKIRTYVSPIKLYQNIFRAIKSIMSCSEL